MKKDAENEKPEFSNLDVIICNERDTTQTEKKGKQKETGHLFDRSPAQYWPLATLIIEMASLISSSLLFPPIFLHLLNFNVP